MGTRASSGTSGIGRERNRHAAGRCAARGGSRAIPGAGDGRRDHQQSADRREPLPLARSDTDGHQGQRSGLEGQHMTTTPRTHTSNEQPLTLFWFLPTGGDGPYLGSTIGHRPADFGYLREIAVAADRLGFGGGLLPTGNK